MRTMLIIVKKLLFIGALLGGFFLGTGHAFAQTSIPEESFYRAKVLTIVKTGTDESFGDPFQDVRVQFESGLHEGTEKEIHVVHSPGQKAQKLEVGDRVVVLETTRADGSVDFAVMDLYRLPRVIMLVAFFFLMVIVVLGWKRGISSILGLLWSIAVLMFWVVPQIAEGKSPFWVSLFGAFLIVTFSVLLSHGLRRQTLVASFSTLITLLISITLAIFSIKFTQLFGFGTENAQFLISSPLGTIDLRGLLLSGIIIGTLGVLDDVTMSQAAAVEEIQRANKNLTLKDLYKRGMSVGKEHIIALVNTLVLAYAGAALPVLLLLSIYSEPLWVTLSSEMIVEEIVRSISGSLSLMLAVPITTFLAAYILTIQHEKN